MSNDLLSRSKTRIKKYPRYFYGILIILCLLATWLIYYVLRLPSEVVETRNDNNIIQETVFTFKADVKPFVLHPEGGIIHVDKEAFTKVTKDLFVHINSSIKSNHPVKVSGSKEVVLNLNAENMWQKAYVLEPKVNFDMEGSDIILIDKEYLIGLDEMTSFMKQVEESISAIPSKYLFEIIPAINGTITDNGTEVMINNQDVKAVVEYSQVRVIIGEQTEFLITTPVINTSVVQREYSIAGIVVSLFAVKIFSSFLYIILLAVIIVAFRYIKANDPPPSKIDRINKKYKARFVTVLNSLTSNSSNNKIKLDSFGSLLKISNEKDALIFTYQDNDSGKTEYYVIDEGYMYIYQASSIAEEC